MYKSNPSGDVALSHASLRRYLATSNRLLPRLARRFYHGVHTFSLPAPRLIVKPMLWVFLAGRFVWHFLRRVFIAEPILKAYCKQYGKNLRSDIFIHWIQGKGDIVLGDDVVIYGKCSFSFASRFADRPVLLIGDGSKIGHACSFIIGKRIEIGRHCIIAPESWIFDSNGHPLDTLDRRAGKPPSIDEVKPVIIGNDVWIGRHVFIFPGVTIGDGSIVSAGSVVRTHIPPYSVALGNPAKVVARLPKRSESFTIGS